MLLAEKLIMMYNEKPNTVNACNCVIIKQVEKEFSVYKHSVVIQLQSNMLL